MSCSSSTSVFCLFYKLLIQIGLQEVVGAKDALRDIIQGIDFFLASKLLIPHGLSMRLVRNVMLEMDILGEGAGRSLV